MPDLTWVWLITTYMKFICQIPDQKDFHGDCEREGTGRENPKKAKASFLTKKIDRTSIVLFGVLYIIFNCIYFGHYI